MRPWIGISLGDVTGISLEVTLKALAIEAQTAPPHFRYLLMGPPDLVHLWNQKLGLSLQIETFHSYDDKGTYFVTKPSALSFPMDLSQGSATSALAAIESLREAAHRSLRGEIQAMVTAPVNKAAIIRSGTPFVGQTEFLSELANTSRTSMMILGEDDRNRPLRVVLATTHLPLSQVAANLTQAKVEQAIDLAGLACEQLGLTSRRIGVCGLNPHAGESGELGDEEAQVIQPAVDRSQRAGWQVEGPLPADTLFYHAFRGDYDVVVAMYHDQGLCPVKMIGFEKGINWTLGLPFIRTSPDHGTAYNIAGQGIADPSSMLAAIKLAQKLILRSSAKSLG